MQETWVRSLGWEDPLEDGTAYPWPEFRAGEFHGRRSLAGCSLQGHKESDTTERLSFTSLPSGPAPEPGALGPACAQPPAPLPHWGQMHHVAKVI